MLNAVSVKFSVIAERLKVCHCMCTSQSSTIISIFGSVTENILEYFKERRLYEITSVMITVSVFWKAIPEDGLKSLQSKLLLTSSYSPLSL